MHLIFFWSAIKKISIKIFKAVLADNICLIYSIWKLLSDAVLKVKIINYN